VHESFWLYARKALSAVSMQEACGDSVQPCFQPKSAAGPGELDRLSSGNLRMAP
jgi:hypothetical protein